jgi:chemotaxis protein methyltransferase CheR
MSDLNLSSTIIEEDLDLDETEKLLKFIQNKTGMVFNPRLHTVVRKSFNNIKNISKANDKKSFLQAITNGTKKLEAQALFESLTVHETMFFRDAKYFNFLEKVLFPSIIENNKSKRSINIWVAAGSSGQEAYSILMLLFEKFPEIKDWSINIYSTDISQKIIDKADTGIYEEHEIKRGLPDEYKSKYFDKVDESKLQVKQNYRSKIHFKVSNLVEDFSLIVPNIDFISCRNVLIYFDEHTKNDIVKRLSEKVNPDGYLILGQVDYINSKLPSPSFEYRMLEAFPFYRRINI